MGKIQKWQIVAIFVSGPEPNSGVHNRSLGEHPRQILKKSDSSLWGNTIMRNCLWLDIWMDAAVPPVGQALPRIELIIKQSLVIKNSQVWFEHILTAKADGPSPFTSAFSSMKPNKSFTWKYQYKFVKMSEEINWFKNAKTLRKHVYSNILKVLSPKKLKNFR